MPDKVPRARPFEAGAQEQAAIDAARRGDLRAWEGLIRRHQELVYRSAYLATRDSASAEEVTKSTFVRAYRSLRTLEGTVQVRPWLLGITATVARAHLRALALQRDAKMPETDPCPRVPASPPLLVNGGFRPTAVEHEALVTAFDGLSDDDRVVIASRYGFFLSRDEGATRLGLSSEQIEERLAATMRRLRARVAETMTTLGPPQRGSRSSGISPAPVDRLALVADDELGALTMAVVLSELRWTPDVAPAVCTRLEREAVAYPEETLTGPRRALLVRG